MPLGPVRREACEHKTKRGGKDPKSHKNGKSTTGYGTREMPMKKAKK